MAITVNPDGLAADGAALADWPTAESPPGCEPASAHSVSVGVAKQFSAHSASLTVLINHARVLLAEGGAATQHTGASHRAADDAGANVIAGRASTSGPVSAPMARASVPAPVLPGIPPMPPPAPMTGEAHATALHTGLGAACLREFACHCQSWATSLENHSAETSQTSASIDAHWSDGRQQAGVNTAVHAIWWSDMAAWVRTMASAANEAADHHDRAVAATPRLHEFADAHKRLRQAKAANVASRGLLTVEVSAAAAHLAQLHSEATDAAGVYYTSSASVTASIAGTPAPAPPIATGSNSPASATHSGKSTAENNTGAASSVQPASNPGVAATGTAVGTGTGSLEELAMGLLPAATMLPMTAMMPMSALSGLAGLSRSPTAATRLANGPGAAAPDPGVPGDLDLGATSPAADGGGGAEAVGTVTSAPPVAGPSRPLPTAVSSPAASVGSPAEGAATAPAGAAGSAGMTTYPPTMGAAGAGAGGDQRNMRLYPDRRAVWRPPPNSEAVFGELQRERRPRVKRAAPEEGTDEG